MTFPDDVLAMTEVMGTGIMLMMGISIMQKTYAPY